jgi:hypothetical protein
MSLLLIVIGFVVAFFVLRWAGRFYFAEPRRSDVFAIAVVAAYAFGLLWPFLYRHVVAPGPDSVAAGVVAPAAAPAGPPPVVKAVSAKCRASGTVTPSTRSLGNLDVIGEIAAGVPVARTTGFTLLRSGTLALEGWAADAGTKTPALAACLMIDGKVQPQAIATYGMSRPDVATAYHSDAMTGTGFLLTLDAKALAPGNHAIAIAVVTSSGVSALASKGTVVVQ